LKRKLPRHYDAADSQAARQLDTFGAGETHLCAAVDIEFRVKPADQSGDAEVLNDDGVGARAGDFRERSGGRFELVVEDQGVEGYVSLNVTPVQGFDHLRQLRKVKPTFARAEKCFRPKYTASAPASIAARSCGQYPAGLMISGLRKGNCRDIRIYRVPRFSGRPVGSESATC